MLNPEDPFNLNATPYLLDQQVAKQVQARLNDLKGRVTLLRRSGALSEQTLKDYYGEKRFEQVAESNAIEGNTLSAGETELAVLKGITITGHDPAFTKDAMALDRALTRISELARDTAHPTNIQQLHEVHSLLLGERLGAGIFRKERVVIRGAKHVPPKTWEQIMKMMADWETWSTGNVSLPAPLRSAVLHAWLTHVHPYIDGNGRISRAIGNLELIRAGYPPIIIKKKERDRYIEALAESDEGGDIRSFLELVFDRIEGGLKGLELSAKRKQAFDPIIEKVRQTQKQQLRIWADSVKLLASSIEHQLSQITKDIGGICTTQQYDEPLDLDDYLEVCNGHSVSRSWAFTIRVEIPGVPRLEKLAYVGYASKEMSDHLSKKKRTGGPSLYWSSKNQSSFPKWIADGPNSPYAMEITSIAGNGDEWFVRRPDGSTLQVQSMTLAREIATALVRRTYGDPRNAVTRGQ